MINEMEVQQEKTNSYDLHVSESPPLELGVSCNG